MLVVQDSERALEVENVTGSMALALMSPWLRLKVNVVEDETSEAVEKNSGRGLPPQASLAEIHHRFNTIIFARRSSFEELVMGLNSPRAIEIATI